MNKKVFLRQCICIAFAFLIVSISLSKFKATSVSADDPPPAPENSRLDMMAIAQLYANYHWTATQDNMWVPPYIVTFNESNLVHNLSLPRFSRHN